ncbi:MAG TPA: serine hydrolase domain-containing protein [Gemmatimonadales bacterium]|nr:serine hydrolase domain-containing protein [Gemmatimonadales bacterium]
MRRLIALFLLPLPLLAQAHPAGAERLRSHLDRTVAEGKAAGIVAVVMQHGEVIFSHATGMSDREAGRPMTADALFRIASQTKALTSVAAMTLVEDGTLALGDPVSRWLPAFAQATVSESFDSAGSSHRRVVPVRRAITIRDLLTHSAGMSYGTEAHLRDAYKARGLGPAAGFGWYFADRDTDICTALAPLAELPLAAQPGERFVYGYATDLLGCIIEQATGRSLATYIRDRITDPLGLHDTSFCVPPESRGRLSVVYSLGPSGLTRADTGTRGQGHFDSGPCRAYGGGAGMVSTARDYARFLEMIRRGGTLDGARIMAPATARLMTMDHIDDLYLGPEWGFGLGFSILLDPGKAGEYGS